MSGIPQHRPRPGQSANVSGPVCSGICAFLGICEPTGGYYGATLHRYLLDQGYEMWLVENHTTQTMREKIFGSLPKTDEMDARVMARICYLHEAVGEEFALRPLRLMSPDDRELLALCRESWKLKQTLTGYKNHFTQLMAVVFPELKTFFTKSVSTVAPVTLIAAYPTPAEIAAAPAADLKALLWQAEAYHHAKRVHELQALARRSSGLLPDPARAWRLQWLTQLLLANYTGRKELDRQLKAIVRQRPEYQWIQDVPYATETTLGTIIAATGDIHRFRNMRRYVAYTGFFPGLQTSQTINRTRMSKRGNRDLKRTYFQIAAMLVWFDPRPNRYKALFERKLAEGRPWYKAMPFVCAALARHIYHFFTIYEKAILRPIGFTYLSDIADQKAEFAIVIGKRECHGKGYGTETTKLVLDYAFNILNLHNVMLKVLAYNEAGIRAYKKAGFQEIGRRREAKMINGKRWDMIYMDCLATEFQSLVFRQFLMNEGPDI